MKIICSKEELLKGTLVTQLAIGSKTNLPVLNNFLLETEGDKIKIAATDLEIGVKSYIKGEIVQPGIITIPAKKFVDIIKELPKEAEINVEKNNITITSGKAKFSLIGISAEEFPILPDISKEKCIEIDVKIIKEMIQKTAFAVSHDETRYVLNGIYMIIENKKIKMVATDGRRLSFISKDVTIPISANSKPKIELIIPSKAINELNRLLSAQENIKDKKINIAITENQIMFKLDDTVLISRLIEGNFPNYDQVIPQSYKYKIKIDTEQLLKSTKRVALLTSEKSNSIKYILEENRLKISANIIGVGEAEDEIDIEYDKELMEIAYNPNYVMDVLKNIDSKEIYLELNESLSPGVIKPTEKNDYVCVIMPMKI